MYVCMYIYIYIYIYVYTLRKLGRIEEMLRAGAAWRRRPSPGAGGARGLSSQNGYGTLSLSLSVYIYIHILITTTYMAACSPNMFTIESDKIELYHSSVTAISR